jgi:hypothetical protein
MAGRMVRIYFYGLIKCSPGEGIVVQSDLGYTDPIPGISCFLNLEGLHIDKQCPLILLVTQCFITSRNDLFGGVALEGVWNSLFLGFVTRATGQECRDYYGQYEFPYPEHMFYDPHKKIRPDTRQRVNSQEYTTLGWSDDALMRIKGAGTQ